MISTYGKLNGKKHIMKKTKTSNNDTPLIVYPAVSLWHKRDIIRLRRCRHMSKDIYVMAPCMHRYVYTYVSIAIHVHV